MSFSQRPSRPVGLSAPNGGHRFTVVVTGDRLSLEYRDTGEVETFPVHPGQADWERGINAGTETYEEGIVFFTAEPGMEPQSEAE